MDAVDIEIEDKEEVEVEDEEEEEIEEEDEIEDIAYDAALQVAVVDVVEKVADVREAAAAAGAQTLRVLAMDLSPLIGNEDLWTSAAA